MKDTVSDRKIINFLNQHSTYVSAEMIANEFHVSTKTIYRRVARINAKYEDKLIESEKGKGFRIVLNLPTSVKKETDFESNSPEERRKNVSLKLLFNAPRFLDIDYLFQREYVSESTAFLDVGKIKEQLSKFELQVLQKVKKVSVQGNERDIREAINDLLRNENVDLIKAPIEGISLIDATFIQEQIDFVQRMSQREIPYPYNINIFSHIYILIQRSRHHTHKPSDVYNPLIEATIEEIELYPDLYRIAEMVIENVSNYIVKKMPEFEVIYLFRYLVSSRLVGNSNRQKEEPLYSELVIYFTQELVKDVSQRLGFTIDEKNLNKELIRHIGPMINRIENGISIENALLSDIKMEYEKLYDLIKQETAKTSKKLNIAKVSDNEIGFIILYFAKYIEQAQKEYHVWIVCASGVGTSELLKVKVQKAFSNIIVDRVIASLDQELYDRNKKIDLIISTVELPEKFQAKSVIVSALLSEQDKEKIKGELYQ